MDTYEVACLTGRDRALAAALVALRIAAVITVDPLSVTRPLPPDAHPLERAVHRYLGQKPSSFPDLASSPDVRKVLDELAAGVASIRDRAAALTELQRENPQLRPGPDLYWIQESATAALAVALHGLPALRVIDQNLARAIEAPPVTGS